MLTVSNRGMPPDSDNLALLAALPYLAPLASPDIELVLERSEMSAEFAALLHELVAQGWSKMSLTGVRYVTDTHTHTHARTHGHTHTHTHSQTPRPCEA